jgi:hypothetical protein
VFPFCSLSVPFLFPFCSLSVPFLFPLFPPLLLWTFLVVQVNPKAQDMVPVPEGLALDVWINKDEEALEEQGSSRGAFADTIAFDEATQQKAGTTSKFGGTPKGKDSGAVLSLAVSWLCLVLSYGRSIPALSR